MKPIRAAVFSKDDYHILEVYEFNPSLRKNGKFRALPQRLFNEILEYVQGGDDVVLTLAKTGGS